MTTNKNSTEYKYLSCISFLFCISWLCISSMRLSSSCRLNRSDSKKRTKKILSCGTWIQKYSRKYNSCRLMFLYQTWHQYNWTCLVGAGWPGAHGRHPPFRSPASHGPQACSSPPAASAASPFHPGTSNAWSTQIQKCLGEQNGEVPLALYKCKQNNRQRVGSMTILTATTYINSSCQMKDWKLHQTTFWKWWTNVSPIDWFAQTNSYHFTQKIDWQQLQPPDHYICNPHTHITPSAGHKTMTWEIWPA